MFDNKIDWVMRIGSASPYRRPQGCPWDAKKIAQYKAEHIVGLQQCGDASVQCKKSVFRSIIRACVSTASDSQAEIQ
jgi:hypothetical protein